TNKNFFKIVGLTEEEYEKSMRKAKSKKRGMDRFMGRYERRKWRVETYLSHPFRLGLARNIDHYDADTLRKVFYQNHVNASVFEFLVILSFLIIGAFQYTDFFIIPAAASFCLVFTVMLMVISILMSRL